MSMPATPKAYSEIGVPINNTANKAINTIIIVGSLASPSFCLFFHRCTIEKTRVIKEGACLKHYSV